MNGVDPTTPDAGDVLLSVSDLDLGFGGLSVLREVGFEARRGEMLAIIGPNGAGKTSLFNCLNGVYRPDAGQILLEGTELIGRRPSDIASMGVARTFQNLALFPNLDVIDNLMLGRHHLMSTGLLGGMAWIGRARREERVHRARCLETVELLGLGAHLGRPVGGFPYGVQKRIELGRALVMEPTLLLLDEPVAGMNAEETADMARAVLHVEAELGITMILVEHDMHLVMDLARRIVVLSFGEVIAVGTPAEVAANPLVIEAYLGREASSQ